MLSSIKEVAISHLFYRHESSMENKIIYLFSYYVIMKNIDAFQFLSYIGFIYYIQYTPISFLLINIDIFIYFLCETQENS